MESGYDLSDLRPANLDPNARVLGNHAGPAYALNVVKPEAGRHYLYVRRDDGEIQRFENEGFQLDRRDNTTARMGRESDPAYGHNLDGVIGRRDIVRMSIDEAGYAAYMARKTAVRVGRSAENIVNEFIAKGEPLTRQLNSNAPIYHRGPLHRHNSGVPAAGDIE